MSSRLLRCGVVAGVVLGSATVVTAAGAQVAPIGVEPTSGPPGTTITASGSDCDGTEVAVRLLLGDDTLDLDTVAPTAGAWIGTLEVPDDDSLGGADLAVTADCIGGTTAYGPASFSVDDVDPTTTTTSTTTTTTTQPTTTTSRPGSPGPSSTTTTTRPTPTTQAPSPRTPAAPVTKSPSFAG